MLGYSFLDGDFDIFDEQQYFIPERRLKINLALLSMQSVTHGKREELKGFLYS